LVRTNNWPLLVVVGVALVVRGWKLGRQGRLRAVVPGFGWLLAGWVVPLGAWLGRNCVVLHDWTGTAEKTRILTWTAKPFGEWFSHPLFSLRGLWEFLSVLVASFWRGELTWFQRRLTTPELDGFCVVTSVGLCAVALVSLLRGGERVGASLRRACWLGLTGLGAGVVFLAVLSVSFDFHECFYPSQAYPYLNSGRLLTGALIPFVVVYVQGLDWVLRRWEGERVRWVVLGVIGVFLAVSEVVVYWPVFGSQYNWFHMVGM
jgi:hypothetical protein